MAEAIELNLPLGEGGAESVEKIIKPLLDLEKDKSTEESDNPFSIENYYPDDLHPGTENREDFFTWCNPEYNFTDTFDSLFEIDKDKLVPKKTEKSEIIIGLKRSIELIEKTKLFEPENLEIEFRALAEELGLKAGQLFFPIRIALTGRRESPTLFDTMKAIGTESSIKRLNNAINILE